MSVAATAFLIMKECDIAVYVSSTFLGSRRNGRQHHLFAASRDGGGGRGRGRKGLKVVR